MTKPQAESYEVTEQKIEALKEVLCGFWAIDLQRAWKCGFDAGRNSVGIVPIVERPKNKKRVRSQEGKARE